MSSRLNQKIHSHKVNKLQDALFIFTLVVIPFQLGKHFWPGFSYVDGQRIDYLSPTIYVSDISITALFVVTLLLGKFTAGRKNLVFTLGVMLFLSIGIFFSSSPIAGWYSLLKIGEMAFFGWYVAQATTGLGRKIFIAFFVGVGVEGILGLLQVIYQGSLGGLWYFLGERMFTAATPGIANASIRGQLVLRPYATFPHPNVFAGYLVLSLFFFLAWIFTRPIRPGAQDSKQRAGIFSIFPVGIVLFGFIVLLLTLSRAAIVVFVLLSFAYLFRRFSWKKTQVLLLGCFFLAIAIFSGTVLLGRFLDMQGYSQAFYFRDVLMQSALRMFFFHPLLGVGLGNFLPSLPYYLSSRILFGFIQPVHNIFLYVLSETGIVGFLLFIILLFFAFKNNFYQLRHAAFSELTVVRHFSLLALSAICLIGLTDHYFLTLQQGQLLFALVLGISFSRSVA